MEAQTFAVNCLDGTCDPRAAQPLGGACTTDGQCPDSRCEGGLCGGFEAYCDDSYSFCAPGCRSRLAVSSGRPYDADFSFAGFSVICSNDFRCTRRPLVPLGGTCADDRDCPRGVKCYSNICGSVGATCGDNSTCAAGCECMISCNICGLQAHRGEFSGKYTA